MLRIVLITGISGSGKSVALRFLEDAGYTCVDNLPVRFLHEFIAGTREDGLERVAIAIDARFPGELAALPAVITSLRAQGPAFNVIDRKRVVQGKGVSVREDLAGRRIFKTKTNIKN